MVGRKGTDQPAPFFLKELEFENDRVFFFGESFHPPWD